MLCLTPRSKIKRLFSIKESKSKLKNKHLKKIINLFVEHDEVINLDNRNVRLTLTRTYKLSKPILRQL